MNPIAHELEFRVRYSETDAMGFMHHANYINYLEIGRVEFLRAQGSDYGEIEKRGYFLVVVETSLRFRGPARFDDVLKLTTTLKDTSRTRLMYEYEIRKDNTILVNATTTLACINRAGKVQRISDIVALPQ